MTHKKMEQKSNDSLHLLRFGRLKTDLKTWNHLQYRSTPGVQTFAFMQSIDAWGHPRGPLRGIMTKSFFYVYFYTRKYIYIYIYDICRNIYICIYIFNHTNILRCKKKTGIGEGGVHADVNLPEKTINAISVVNAMIHASCKKGPEFLGHNKNPCLYYR